MCHPMDSIFILCMSSALIVSVLSTDIAVNVHNLTANQVIYIQNDDQSYRLDIFCSFGQNVSIFNLLMSSYLELIEMPEDVRVITAPYWRQKNRSLIVKHFENKWSLMSGHRWFDTNVVTNITIPSFNVYCIGFVTKESYKCQLQLQRIDINRVISLLIGFSLFIFGPNLSRSILFYYTLCIGIGVFASFLIIFVIVGRYLPRKISGIIILLGSSAVMFAFKIFWQTLHHLVIEHSFYVVIYTFLMSFVSFGAAYRFGPVTNHKTLNLIQWSLQSIGLLLMVISSELYEYSLLFILSIVALKVLPIKQLLFYKSDLQTRKSLQELKSFCLSSECNAWNTICKLKDPIRFARFIDGENHLSDDEIVAYESSDMNSFNHYNYNRNEEHSEEDDEDNSEDNYHDSQ